MVEEKETIRKYKDCLLYELVGSKKEVFLVLVRQFSKINIYCFNKEKTLWLFGVNNRIRRWAIYAITNKIFEFFMIATILINCLFLAMNNAPEVAEYVFTGIYTLEMILKILAKGLLLHHFAYLRDAWNWLDFIVVILGYITLMPGVVNLSGISTFRVLRALRTISAIEELKTMVNALLNAMKMMSSVIILTAFFICIFALIGLQIFSGVFHQKCVLNAIIYNSSASWLKEVQNPLNWHAEIPICGNNSGSLQCPVNYTCQQNAAPNPNYGFMSFDNIGWAMLTSFQIVNRDYWEEVYLGVTSALGPWYILYFLMVIFFGSFYLINLILAVVVFSYQQETSCNVDLDVQYRFLRQVLLPFCEDRHILPIIIVDNSIINKIKNLSCVKLCSNMLILPLKDELNGIRHNSLAYNFTNTINRKVDHRVESYDTINKKVLEDCCDLKISLNYENESLLSNIHRASIKKSNISKISQSFKLELYASISHNAVTSLRKFKQKLNQFVISSWFEYFILISILMNTICLALETHDMQVKLKNYLKLANYAFTAIFATEMLLKVIALTLKRYMKQMWNILDGFVAILSIAEIILEMTSFSKQRGFTIIRSLRLFRIFKLAKSWPTMRLLFTTIARSLTALGSITLILIIILYMFAVVGTKCFGYKYKAEKFPHKKIPVWNFTDFHHSFMLIFRVLCGEWIELLYDAMLVGGTWAVPFFLIVLIVGNFLVLNLFVALLLNSFAVRVMEENLKKRKARLNWVSAVQKVNIMRRAFKRHKSEAVEVTSAQENNLLSIFKISSVSEESGKNCDLSTSIVNVDQIKKDELSCNKLSQDKFRFNLNTPRLFQYAKKIYTANQMFSKGASNKRVNPSMLKKEAFICCIKYCSKDGCSGKKYFGIFTYSRMRVKKFVEHKWFDNFVLTLIIASSFVLVFDDINLSSKPVLSKILEVLNINFTVLFFIEFLLKIFAIGIVEFLRKPWNSFEFVVVVLSMASVLNDYAKIATNVNAIRSLRTLRALRPLRAISRWKGIKIVVNSLLAAIPSIANVFLVCIVFWLIFSILGVQLFGGKFFKCVNQFNERIDAAIIPNKTMCLAHGYQWKNSNANFDNALNGFLPLFQVAVFEGWIEIMRDAVDATEVDMQPVSDNNFFAYLYFVIFIIIGAFFILNLFVSVIIDNFYRLKKQFDGCETVEVNLSALQKQWLLSVKNALAKKSNRLLQKPKDFYLSKLFDIITSPKCEGFIILLVVCNILLMMCQHFNQSDSVTGMLHYVNLIFTTIFSTELILRFMALRWYYFSNGWNVFDLIIVVLSIVGIIMESLEMTLSASPNVFRVARVLRIGRLLRYFNSGKGIRRLMIALLVSLPALLNIGALLFLILFIYSIIGMSTFAHIKKQGALSNIVNFETFGNSIMVLFRLATSAGWNEILDALVIQPPNCDQNFKNIPNGNCGTPWVAVVYLVSFILITFLVVINLYIAIILENFNEVHRHDDIGITDEDIEMFYSVWQLYDPSATNYIEFQKLPFLVANLGSPLGIPFPNRIAVHNLNLPIIEGDKIHCVDVLQALLKRKFDDSDSFINIRDAVDRTLENVFPDRLKYTSRTTTMIRFQEIKAAYTIQKYYRKWKEKNDFNKGVEIDVVKDTIGRFARGSITSVRSFSKLRNIRHEALEDGKSNNENLSNLSCNRKFSLCCQMKGPNAGDHNEEFTSLDNLKTNIISNRFSINFIHKRRSECEIHQRSNDTDRILFKTNRSYTIPRWVPNHSDCNDVNENNCHVNNVDKNF